MNIEQLKQCLTDYDISFNDEQINLLVKYMDYTLSENEKYNLTAITNKDDFLEKMIFDSALVLSDFDLDNSKLIDVGTGAGYPGMILNILSSKSDITYLDSTAKKINFIHEFALANNLKSHFVNARVEEYARNNKETFDYATARAVASLPILIETIAPLLKVGGQLIALKGLNYEEEINASENAMDKLGLKIAAIREFELPYCKEKRAIIHLLKVKHSNNKYPRDYADIKKRPL